MFNRKTDVSLVRSRGVHLCRRNACPNRPRFIFNKIDNERIRANAMENIDHARTVKTQNRFIESVRNPTPTGKMISSRVSVKLVFIYHYNFMRLRYAPRVIWTFGPTKNTERINNNWFHLRRASHSISIEDIARFHDAWRSVRQRARDRNGIRHFQ